MPLRASKRTLKRIQSRPKRVEMRGYLDMPTAKKIGDEEVSGTDIMRGARRDRSPSSHQKNSLSPLVIMPRIET